MYPIVSQNEFELEPDTQPKVYAIPQNQCEGLEF